jgi:predicted metal-dependent peptidase
MLDIELPSMNRKTPGKGDIKEDDRAESRNWENRVKRAAAGDRPGGIMKEILFDIPITKTPWRYLLRKYVSEVVMPRTQIKPTRPSRHAIILDSFYKETCSECLVPFFPAHQPMPGVRKIVIVIDTSGSIDDHLCEYFAGEIQSVRAKVGCDLVLITCDAVVHQTIKVNTYDNLHSIIKAQGGFNGRGGTNFVPGVEAAEKVAGASVIIYLTDMMGPYPDKCRVPLIWASISKDYIKPPVGRVIIIEPDSY